MAQDYDNMGKSLWRDHADDLSRFVLGAENVEVLEDLDTEQQTLIARQTDITKRVRVNNQEAILHVELQLRDSTRKPMWARSAQYQMPVYSNVIYFHPTAGRNDTGGYEYSWNGYAYTLHYKVIRLIEIEGQAILEAQAPGLLPLTPLMKPPVGMTLERWVQECVDTTMAAPVDQWRQADLLYGIYLFGGVVFNSELLDRLIPEELMRESKTYQRQQEKIAKETTIENTLALLADQFQPETVSALTPAIRNVNDLQKLKQLLLAAARVRNIEDFTQMLYE